MEPVGRGDRGIVYGIHMMHEEGKGVQLVFCCSTMDGHEDLGLEEQRVQKVRRQARLPSLLRGMTCY